MSANGITKLLEDEGDRANLKHYSGMKFLRKGYSSAQAAVTDDLNY